jgi:aminoglycoside phosphotransferase (APT) family kinase protein
LAGLLESLPTLFAGRPVVLAHGDFPPVNVLTDSTSLTGLLDFESVRLADPLFDVAWWAWAVSFASRSVLRAAWLAFLQGAGIDPADPLLPARVHALQVLRMLELVADETSLSPDVRRVVADRLRAMLR